MSLGLYLLVTRLQTRITRLKPLITRPMTQISCRSQLQCNHKGVQKTSQNGLRICSTGLRIGANRGGPGQGPYQAPGAGFGREAAQNRPVLPPSQKTKSHVDCIGVNIMFFAGVNVVEQTRPSVPLLGLVSGDGGSNQGSGDLQPGSRPEPRIIDLWGV